MAIRDLVVTTASNRVSDASPLTSSFTVAFNGCLTPSGQPGRPGREGHSVSDGVDAPLDDEWIGFAHDVGILVLVVKP
jgi:hypothetical protein